jgi:hypothetical protein
LVSIGLVVSEEKIFEKVYDDDGRQVMAIAHMAIWGRVLGNNSKTVNNIRNLTG